MEGSESSINRIGRSIWTVWGYLTGAVGRYLRPESPNKDNQDAPFEQEDAISNVTQVKSYRELKEDEEKSETEAGPQREKPQCGVSVRTAAVQWEKIHSGDTSKRSCTGVVWNAAVQKEVLDIKTQEQRDTEETLNNNNKAAQSNSNDVFEKADPASTDADIGSPDFGVPRSFDKDAEDKGDENYVDAEEKEDENATDDVAESESAENEEEEIHECAGQEEECDFGDEVNIKELSVEKVTEHTEDNDGNKEDDDEQRNQGMTRDEDETSTHTADDLPSQLTYSTKEREDLLNKEIKVDDEYIEETMEHEASTTPEREVVDVSDEEAGQETVGMEKNGQQEESKVNEAQIEFLKEMVETECKLLEEHVASEEAEHIRCSVESTQTPEGVAIEEKMQDTVGTIKHGQHETGQQLSESEGWKSSDELDVCESKLDGAQNDIAQEIVGTTCESLQEPVTRQMENAEIFENEPEPLCKGVEIEAELTPERDSIDGIEETNQGAVGTVKDVEHEAGQELSESHVVEAVDVYDSKLDEKCMEKTTENEAAEREGSDTSSEEMKQGTVGMVQDGWHEASQQLNVSKGTKTKLDESQTDFFERMVETECKLLEELVASQKAEHTSCTIEKGSTPTPERVDIEAKLQDTVGMIKDGQHEAGQQLSESEGWKSSDELDVSKSKLDGAQNDLTQEIDGTTCESLQEPVTRQMANAEICEHEPEPLCKGVEIEAELTPERDSIDGIEETNQGTVGTVKDVEHEAGQELSESHIVEAVDVYDSQLVEKCMEETTENEAARTPEREGSDINSEEIKQDTVEIVQDGQQEAGQQLNVSKASETKLGESQIEFVERIVETECKLLEELVASQESEHTNSRQMENAEIYENEPEPLCKRIEIKAELTPERGSIDGIKETNQGNVGTVKDMKHEVGQELNESHIVEAVDVYDSQCMEKCMEETTENKAAERVGSDTSSEEIKRGTVEIVQDGQQEASEQLNESKASETKLGESQIEFVERLVETECKLLEELELETCKDEEEPISQSIERKAAVTPERELIDTIEVTKPDTLGTENDKQHEMGHHLSRSKGFENVDKPDIQESNLVAQNEHTDGRAETEYEPLEEPVTGQMENAEIYEEEAELNSEGLFKLSSGDEAGDSDLTAVVMEANQVEHHEEETEAGNTPETEVELSDIIGSQVPEEAIKQGIELVLAGPGNQYGTSQTISNFSQNVRAEVAACNVKKSTEIVRSLHPTATEKCALQETLGQRALEQGSLQEKSIDGNASDSGSLDALFSGMQRSARRSSSAGEVNEAAFCETPSSSPQELDDTQDTTETSAVMVTEPTVDETKAGLTEQKMEVLETHSKLTAVSDHDMAEAKCELSKAKTGPQTEGESYSATVEMLKQSSEAEAPVPDDRSESQIPLNCGVWTVQGGAGGETETCGQIKHSGASDLAESEAASEKLEMLRNPHKDAELRDFKMFELKRYPEKEGESPDEAEIGMPEEIKAMTASSEDVEEIICGLTQGSEERFEAGTIKTREEETAVEASESNSADLQTHNELLSNIVENKNNLQVETIDVDSDVREKTESMKEKLLNAPEEHEDRASKVDEGETAVDSNKSLQERNRSGLKRGPEKMARNEEAKPSVAKGWAALEQVSSLDCTVQKSKIAVKNRFSRPPKNPRTLINMISEEPSVAPRPAQPSVVKKAQGVGPSVLPPGVIGFKLPGLGGGGLPVLRKTDAGKKMRDEDDAQSVTTSKSGSQTDLKEDCGKKELPASKPKWTPPRHPGMGNPMMMSELKSKLKKSGKD